MHVYLVIIHTAKPNLIALFVNTAGMSGDGELLLQAIRTHTALTSLRFPDTAESVLGGACFDKIMKVIIVHRLEAEERSLRQQRQPAAQAHAHTAHSHPPSSSVPSPSPSSFSSSEKSYAQVHC